MGMSGYLESGKAWQTSFSACIATTVSPLVLPHPKMLPNAFAQISLSWGNVAFALPWSEPAVGRSI